MKPNIPLRSGVPLIVCSLLLLELTTGRGQSQDYSLAFDGTNDAVYVAHSPSLNLTSEVTIEAWVKPSMVVPDAEVLSKAQEFSSEANYNLKLFGGKPTFSYYDGTGQNNYYVADVLVATNQWQHLAVAYNYSTYQIGLYLNGQLQTGSWTTFGGGVPDNPNPVTTPNDLCIGATRVYYPGYGYQVGDPYDSFAGAIDEVRLWRIARSQLDVQANMFAKLTGQEAGLVGYWRLDEGAGTMAYDLTTNANHGVLGGGLAARQPQWAPGRSGCSPPPTGLVSWWPGDGNADDLQGTNNGTLMGGTTVGSGLVGSAFVLDGTNNFVEVPDSTSLKPSDLTVEFWARPDILLTNGAGTVPFVMKLNEGDSMSGVVRGYDFFYQQGKLYFGLPISSGLRNNVFIATNLPAGTWHHVAGAYSSLGQALYLDGQLVASGANFGAIAYSPAPIEIGRVVNLSPFYFKGAIDELAIYSRALSSNEIAAIHAAGSAGKCKPACTPPPSGLVSWWRGEGDVSDSAGQNPGLLRNGATFAQGKVGQAFSLDGVDDYVEIPGTSNLFYPRTGSFAIAAWINTTHTTSTGYGQVIFGRYPFPADIELLLMDRGSLEGFISDSGGSWQLLDGSTVLSDGGWHLVMLVRDMAASRMAIYVDGRLETSGPLSLGGGGDVVGDVSAPAFVGALNPHAFFKGLIDDVQVYNRALSTNEISAIYAAGSAGMCRPVQPPVAPSITAQPLSQTVRIGGNATFTITAVGTLPLTYQWSFNGTDLAGATDSSLTLTAVQPAQAGGYSVRVTNSAGWVASTTALLVVLTSVELVSYQADLWRFQQVSQGALSGFESGDEPVGFAAGPAAFGSGTSCPISSTAHTPWSTSTDMLLRREMELPQGVQGMTVYVAIDNDVQAWLNGADISGGMRTHDGCASADSYAFPVPDSLIQSGENLLAIRARDRGGDAFVDVRVTAYQPPAQFATVTIVAIPTNAGSLSGGGTYQVGTNITVIATADTTVLPYIFVNWTQGGVVQSTNNPYTFTLAGDRQLVANFDLPVYQVAASNNPPAAGAVSGAGTFKYGQTNTLTTAANFGYYFANWTENGIVVGTNVSLSTVVYSNRLFIANYAEANTFHVVSISTLPSGLTNIPGSGIYSNGTSATISAPPLITLEPNNYTFKRWTLNGANFTNSPSFTKIFSTTDLTNMSFVAEYNSKSIRPLVVSTTANTNALVPATTNFIVTMQFDRSMQTSVEPLLAFSNAAALTQANIPTGGVWLTTSLTNDTYRTPPITFVMGMDGTNRLFASQATDLAGEQLALTNCLNVLVDATPPAITNISTTPSPFSATITWTTDEPATSQVEYGLTVAYGSITPFASTLVTSHSQTVNGLLPNTIYHFHVLSRDTAGNLTFSPDRTFSTTLAPDLQVTGIGLLPQTNLLSGMLVTVFWTNVNTGPGPTIGSWLDQLVVSNLTTGLRIFSTNVYYDSSALGSIAGGDYRVRQAAVRLPEGLPSVGQLLFVATADINNAIQEYNGSGSAETNNTATTTAISTLAAYPDLLVTGITIPPPAMPGASVQVSWTVTNRGSATATGPWTDALYLSDDPVIGNDQFLANLTYAASLAPGQSLSQTQTVILPSGILGSRFLVANADSGNLIFEVNKANNLAISASAIQFLNPDLVVDSVVVQSSASFGDSIPVVWTVRNAGTGPAVGGWLDRISLSPNPSQAGATPLLTLPITGVSPMAAGAIYTRTQMVTLPLNSSAAPSNYFALVTTDFGNNLFELSETNNTTPSSSISLSLPQLPDLVVTDILPPTNAFAGQTVTLIWSITNQGAATAVGPWTDTILLAVDASGNAASAIASVTYSNLLNPGDSLTRTGLVTLPPSAFGQMFFAVYVNSSTNVFEGTGQTNNLTVASWPTLPNLLTLLSGASRRRWRPLRIAAFM
jgi:hypothetical protein